MNRQQFTALNRDLFFEVQCTCPSYLFKDTDIADIMKHKITLTGYADDNFFDNVNAEPRELSCKCGRRFRIQWFRDGVEFEFIEEKAE